jgi:hypothetical protein
MLISPTEIIACEIRKNSIKSMFIEAFIIQNASLLTMKIEKLSTKVG